QRARAEELWRELDALVQMPHDPLFTVWPLNREALRATLDGELETALASAAHLAARAADVFGFWPLVYLGPAAEALEAISRSNRMAGGGPTTLRPGRVAICLASLGRMAEARA